MFYGGYGPSNCFASDPTLVRRFESELLNIRQSYENTSIEQQGR